MYKNTAGHAPRYLSFPVPHLSVQRVELVDLLTDAAGVMREKFQSKQCFNLCYSVNRESKHIFMLIDTADKFTFIFRLLKLAHII